MRYATVKKGHRLSSRQANIERRAERDRRAQQSKPHVVLGIRPGDDAKWVNCNLAKVLVSTAELQGNNATVPLSAESSIHIPKNLGYGIDGTDELGTRAEKLHLLFEALPSSSAELAIPPETQARRFEAMKSDSLNSLLPPDMQNIGASPVSTAFWSPP